MFSGVLSGRNHLRCVNQPQCGWLISKALSGQNQKRDATMANVPPLAQAVLVLMGFNIGS
jgi:hypothetical protein